MLTNNKVYAIILHMEVIVQETSISPHAAYRDSNYSGHVHKPVIEDFEDIKSWVQNATEPYRFGVADPNGLTVTLDQVRAVNRGAVMGRLSLFMNNLTDFSRVADELREITIATESDSESH